MAAVFRLIAFLFLASSALAAQSQELCPQYTAVWGGKNAQGNTASAAAAAVVALFPTQTTGACPTGDSSVVSYTLGTVSASSFQVRRSSTVISWQPTGGYMPDGYTPAYYCRSYPAQVSESTGYLSVVMAPCPPPPRDLDAECKSWAVQSTTSGNWAFNETPYTLQGKVESGAKCMNPGPGQDLPAGTGCKMDFERTMAAQGADGNWTTYGFFTPPGSYGAQGGSCTLPTGSVPSTSTPTKPPIDCAGGKVPAPGEVNGQTTWYCASPTKSESSQKTSTTTGPNGTASTTKVTECSGAFCTTTTTVTNTSGSSTSTQTSTVTQSKSAFCESSPNDAQCSGIRPGTDTGTQSGTSTGGGGSGGDGEEGGSSFGGACAAGFSCEGDAIQCAIAKEQHLKNCKFWEGESPERTLFTNEAARTGNVTGDNPNNTTGTIGPGSFDTTNALGTQAACITDRTVTVMGASVTLPFSTVCQYLAMLGNVLMGVSMLLAARIVMRG